MKTVTKLTWSEFEKAMWNFNKEHGYTTKGTEKRLEGVVVFTEDSFSISYSERERSYQTDSDQKAFLPNQLGYSIFGDCLDGTDLGVRLDWYMRAEEMPWKVDYCYLLEG
jgi:hypothetical protein